MAKKLKNGTLKPEPGDDTTTLTVVLPTLAKLSIRDKSGQTTEVDRSRYTPEGIRKLFEYGEGRFLKDGAKTQESEKGPDGKVTTRSLTEQERCDEAEANAARKLAALYGEREIRERGGAIDPVVRFLRPALVKWACANLKDAEGKDLTAKTVPSALAKAGTVDAAREAATALGVPADRLEKIVTAAQAMAELEASMDDEPEVNLD